MQVAEREGKYLANLLNTIGKAGGGRANSAKDIEFGEPFVYKHLGSMATIGRYKALVDLRQSKVSFRVYSCYAFSIELSKPQTGSDGNCSGGKRSISCWIPELVYMALGISNKGDKLEE